MKLASVIIVNWNGLQWLKICLPSILNQSYKNIEVIVVDNASTDGSVAWIKRAYKKVRVVINPKNYGFSHANNIGFSQAKGEYVIFLNNDTRVEKSYVSEMVKTLDSQSDIGGVQSKILLMESPDTHDTVGAFLTPTGFLYHYGFGDKNTAKYDVHCDLYTAKGASMGFKRIVLDQIVIDGNLFDPDYFAYFEESDVCHRVLLTGYRIVYAYSSVAYHKMGATSTKIQQDIIQYHSFKNRIRTYLKNFSFRTNILILPIHISLCFAYVGLCMVRRRFSLAWAIIRAMHWNVIHFQSTFRLHRIIRRNVRKITDEIYLKRVMRYPKISYYFSLSKQ